MDKYQKECRELYIKKINECLEASNNGASQSEINKLFEELNEVRSNYARISKENKAKRLIK